MIRLAHLLHIRDGRNVAESEQSSCMRNSLPSVLLEGKNHIELEFDTSGPQRNHVGESSRRDRRKWIDYHVS
jgi:hypothetical protein